ncbi:MAG: hypothetical protein APF80_04555 [Alphaproteobacteria bacterium BRH_c36]|nr:MAG: hypothetical protein APF80_04555 [Alphaproteobacteria bacterium BRH_c36]
MTQTIPTISTAKLAFRTVELAERLQRDRAPAYASVNGHAQALIVKPLPEPENVSTSPRQQS